MRACFRNGLADMTNIALLLIIGVGFWLAWLLFNGLIEGIANLLWGRPHGSRPPGWGQGWTRNAKRR